MAFVDQVMGWYNSNWKDNGAEKSGTTASDRHSDLSAKTKTPARGSLATTLKSTEHTTDDSEARTLTKSVDVESPGRNSDVIGPLPGDKIRAMSMHLDRMKLVGSSVSGDVIAPDIPGYIDRDSEFSWDKEKVLQRQSFAAALQGLEAKPPPKRAARKPVMYITTSSNKLRRVYNNRCERYCMGPITVVVELLGTVVLGLVNLLLLSLALMVIGGAVIIHRRMDPYDKYLVNVAELYAQSMRKFGVKVTEGSEKKLDMIMQSVVVPIYICGGSVGALSLLGVIGTCLEIACLLDLYARCSFIVLLLEFSLFLYIYDGEPEAFKLEVYDSLDEYTGVEGTDAITLAWNQVMNFFNCCGVDNWEDFKRRKKWPPETIMGEKYPLDTPIFCCKEKSGDFSCAMTNFANKDINNMDRGCYDLVYNYVFKNDYAMAFFGILMLLQIIVLFFSSWLVWSAGNKAQMIADMKGATIAQQIKA